jgi:uncharacterized delta-60 repeat protein
MNKINLFLSLLLVVAFSFNTTAQNAGDNDPTFNLADIDTTLEAANNSVYTTALQPDGKIIIGGMFTTFNGISMNRIARLNIDGKLDNTFDIGTGMDSTVQTIAIQNDGKIIVGGEFTNYNGTIMNSIVRLNTDGSLDGTFNIGTGANLPIQTITIQPDGKIIIGGDFTSYNGTLINRIARLNADGSLDGTFNIGTGANQSIRTVTIQSDGQLIIGGSFTSYNGTPINRIARLNTDGSLDTSFVVGTGVNAGGVYTVTIQPDGKIVICGFFFSYNGISSKSIARLNTDGSIDTSFVVGTGVNGSVYTTAIQPDGKIIIGGGISVYNGTPINRIARLNTDGSLDLSFVKVGVIGTIYTIRLQADGQLIIGGSFTSFYGTLTNRIARLNADGTLDGTFIIGTGFNRYIFTTKIQSNGKIIVGGGFSSYNHYSSNCITRLNIDGTRDTTFNIGTGIPNGEVVALATQPDEKIIVGGGFISFNGSSYNNIVRLNIDGTIDTTFNTNIGIGNNYDYITTIAIQSDEKIIVGGDNYGILNTHILRLNTDGTNDTTFTVGTGADSTLRVAVLQPDGKIIIAGYFNSYNGNSSNRIARLNSNGTFDGTFIVGSGANGDINTVTILPDGKIIIGGNFTAYNGTACYRVARLNDDGSIDNTFNIGTGANNQVWTTTLLSDGKILIGGMFTSYNGISKNNVAILNSDGTLDNTFDLGSGANSPVWSSALQADGKIIIAGDFTSYKGVVRNRIARLLNCSINASYNSIDNSNGNYSFTNTSTGSFNQNHWAYGDGTTSTAANPNHTFNANGTYVVVLTVNDSTNASCMDYYLDTIVVTGVVAPLQCAAGFSMYPDAGNVVLVNSSTGSNLTYLWDFGDGNTSNAQFPTHTYSTSGNYYLCLTIDDGAGCVDMYCDSIGENGVVFNKQTGFTINVIAPPLVTQVNEQAALTSGMNIYPNPTGNLLNVVLNEKEHYQLTIVAIDGKWLESKPIVGNTTVDVSKYASGMYFITATNNEGKVYQSKFVKE